MTAGAAPSANGSRIAGRIGCPEESRQNPAFKRTGCPEESRKNPAFKRSSREGVLGADGAAGPRRFVLADGSTYSGDIGCTSVIGKTKTIPVKEVTVITAACSKG
jgi:hypothetical protein